MLMHRKIYISHCLLFFSLFSVFFLEDLSCVKAWLNDFSQERIGDSDLGSWIKYLDYFCFFFVEIIRRLCHILWTCQETSSRVRRPYINWQPLQMWNSLLSTRIIAHIINHRQSRLLPTNQNFSHQPDKHVNFIQTTFFPSCWILLLAIIVDGFHSHRHCCLFFFGFYSHPAHTLGFISWMIFSALLVLQYNCFIIPQILIHRFQFLFVIRQITFLTSIFTSPTPNILFFSHLFFCSHLFFMLFCCQNNAKISFSHFIIEIFSAQQKEPFFESNQNLNVTVLESESVVLKCAVRHKGNKTVSTLTLLPFLIL